jgi:putative ABC transport system permease protein
MVVANLVQRPIRSLISISAVALEVVLILLIVAFLLRAAEWLEGEPDRRGRRRNGAAARIVRPGGGYRSAHGGEGGDKLRALPHVCGGRPGDLGIDHQADAGNHLRHRHRKLQQHSSLVSFLSGRPFQGPYDVIVDDYFAGSKRAKVGDSIEILNNDFRVCGIVEHGKGARKFVPLDTMQDLIGAPGHASVFYVKLDDPASVDAVVDEIKHVPGMENYSVRPCRNICR